MSFIERLKGFFFPDPPVPAPVDTAPTDLNTLLSDNSVLTAEEPMSPTPQPLYDPGATTVSPQGIALLHHFESCRLNAYRDSAGIPTIGWGMTYYPVSNLKVQMGDTITQQQADDMFAALLPNCTSVVLQKVTRPLKQQELDACVSFCYNAGTGYSTANGQRKDYNIWANVSNNYPDIKTYWENLAVTAGGQRLAGLVRRRKAEAHLYLTGAVIFG